MLISVISGSRRHKLLAELLAADGHKVNLYASYSELPVHIGGDAVVLPIPTLNRSGNLNLEGCPGSFTAEELLTRTERHALVISCNYESVLRHTVDINKYEPFTSMNAVPSAEGAIFEAVKNSDITLFGSKCLVIGYGRIGKIIADRMKAFGSDVTVTARSHKDIYTARSFGMTVSGYDGLSDRIASFDLIFQTVPHLILNKEMLDLTDAVIIELASGGAGTDLEYAAKAGKKVIYAPGIPEKYSPDTAGAIFYDSVINIIKEFRRDGFGSRQPNI